jgi:2-dehydropantoate 2-reductase
MKIGIIGAGAMGSLYGAKLSTVKGNEIHLLDIWMEHIDAINNFGLIVEKDNEECRHFDIKATISSEDVGICDLVIVFVKSTLTGSAVEKNSHVFGPDTIVLTLQNGLGNIDKIGEKVGYQNIIAGTTAHGATLLAPGKIKHAGEGKTILGELSGKESERIQVVAKVFRDAGFDTLVSNNVIGLVWEKLIVNVGINALTALTGLLNGELLKHQELLSVMEGAVGEAVQVAKKKGIFINLQDPITYTKNVCMATATNKSSMLQDILNHKATEIDSINGAIVEAGESVGIETPVNRTLTNLIRFKEKK